MASRIQKVSRFGGTRRLRNRNWRIYQEGSGKDRQHGEVRILVANGKPVRQPSISAPVELKASEIAPWD
jgi:hypothetical protein